MSCLLTLTHNVNYSPSNRYHYRCQCRSQTKRHKKQQEKQEANAETKVDSTDKEENEFDYESDFEEEEEEDDDGDGDDDNNNSNNDREKENAKDCKISDDDLTIECDRLSTGDATPQHDKKFSSNKPTKPTITDGEDVLKDDDRIKVEKDTYESKSGGSSDEADNNAIDRRTYMDTDFKYEILRENDTSKEDVPLKHYKRTVADDCDSDQPDSNDSFRQTAGPTEKRGSVERSSSVTKLMIAAPSDPPVTRENMQEDEHYKSEAKDISRADVDGRHRKSMEREVVLKRSHAKKLSPNAVNDSGVMREDIKKDQTHGRKADNVHLPGQKSNFQRIARPIEDEISAPKGSSVKNLKTKAVKDAQIHSHEYEENHSDQWNAVNGRPNESYRKIHKDGAFVEKSDDKLEQQRKTSKTNEANDVTKFLHDNLNSGRRLIKTDADEAIDGKSNETRKIPSDKLEKHHGKCNGNCITIYNKKFRFKSKIFVE